MSAIDAAQQSNATGAPTVIVHGNEHGGSVSVATPIPMFASQNENVHASVGAQRTGAWTHKRGQNWMAGISLSFRF